MNYARHYDALIERAKNRPCLSGYFERHHIVPRCMGGSDEDRNIVKLTAEEHYVAHQLLVRLHHDVPALVTATLLMAKKAGHNKAYGWLRKLSAKAMGQMTERNAKITASMMGNKRGAGNKGKKREFSLEWRAKIGAAQRGRKQSAITIEKRAAALRGRKKPPISQERRDALSVALRGRKMPPVSAETKAKIAATLRGGVRSLESRNRMRIARLAYLARQNEARN